MEEPAALTNAAADGAANGALDPAGPFAPGSLARVLPESVDKGWWADDEDEPAADESLWISAGDALELFFDWTISRGMELWPHQEDALMNLAVGNHVILGTPTGSGKSLVAQGLLLMGMATGRRSYYTAPIKALVSEKFFALVELLGRDNVGMITGDSAINTNAPIICCTAEILANLALREGERADVGCVVMDEFHYYGDAERGWAWQVPLLTLPRAQFLLMSATLGDVSQIADSLQARTGTPVDVVADAPRPVPLSYEYELTPLEGTVELALRKGEAPLYIVHFAQDAALATAQALASFGVATKEQRQEIKEACKGTRFTTAFGKILQRLLGCGVGVHHAGMLPRYRLLVEKLAQQGLLPIICGTDTLGVGINVPIHTVLLTQLTKFDGHKMRRLKAREFHQIAGRAGRSGFDTEGMVIAEAPDHEIENAKLVQKAGGDPKKLRKIKKKQPREGFVAWSEQTFQKLIEAEPERLVPRMRITHSMVLSIVSRGGDAWATVLELIGESAQTDQEKEKLRARAAAIFTTLIEGGVVVQEGNDHLLTPRAYAVMAMEQGEADAPGQVQVDFTDLAVPDGSGEQASDDAAQTMALVEGDLALKAGEDGDVAAEAALGEGPVDDFETASDAAEPADADSPSSDLPDPAGSAIAEEFSVMQFEPGATYRLTVDLPDDFALDQPLSPFMLAALDMFQPEEENYALDVISLVEATLEDPWQVLRAQERKEKDKAIAQMKADGIEYEERLERLEDVTYPKPLADLLGAAFAHYCQAVPWARDYELAPKSVLRDMLETASDFKDYINRYGIARSEGILLRYLSNAYRVLDRSIPASRRDERMDDIIAWLGFVVRSTDSSLMEEWEAGGLPFDAAPPQAEDAVVADRRGLTVLVRNALFARVRLASMDRAAQLGRLDGEWGFGERRWQQVLDDFYDAHESLQIDADARSAKYLAIDESDEQEAHVWHVRQIFSDSEGDHDFCIMADVDLDATQEQAQAVFANYRAGSFEDLAD